MTPEEEQEAYERDNREGSEEFHLMVKILMAAIVLAWIFFAWEEWAARRDLMPPAKEAVSPIGLPSP